MSEISFSCSNTKSEFSVRIVVCDHYLTKPIPGIDVNYSEFRGADIKQVPILRVFGPTPDGYKACLHIHGVFPYFYLPCPVNNPEPQFLYQMAASLDKALNIALKQATSSNQHVYRISLVKGLPFYGFHDKEHLYLKVFLYNPGLIKQAVELCGNGAILGQTFQPHESHLNFTLQFFIDFNLFGMSNIDLQYVKFRKKHCASQNSSSIIESPDEFVLKSESICYYEADCAASHIVNRQRVGRGDGIENPGLEEVWNQELERRKQLNVSMASKSLTQARIHTETDTHHKFEQMFLLKMSDLVDKPVIINEEADNNINVNYPAESVEGSQLLNAIDVSVHLPNSRADVTQNSLRRSLDETLTDDLDNTLVDENVALNCSLPLHYSQVVLDNEDMDLINILQDMDDGPVEVDSILATPADDSTEKEEVDSDDPEYSQIFHEDTNFLEPSTSENKSTSDSQQWNDSFWDGASIPQLDGTFDDDHVKKVRKRKMRPLKVGLSRPKRKETELKNIKQNHVEDINSTHKNENEHNKNISSDNCDKINKDQPFDNIKKEIHENQSMICKSEGQNNSTIGETSKATNRQTIPCKISTKTSNSIQEIDVDRIDNIEEHTSDSDEINTSQETINSVTSAFLRKTIKTEPISFIETYSKVIDENVKQDVSTTEIVTRKSVSFNDVKEQQISVMHNKDEDFEPQAGPSKVEVNTKTEDDLFNTLDYLSPNDSYESSPDERGKGFISFYDKSRIFDVTVDQELFDDDDNNSCLSKNDKLDDILSTTLKDSGSKAQEIKIKSELYPNLSPDEDIKLYFSDMITNPNDNEKFTPKILTPKFRAPTTSYIKSTLDKYKIPNHNNPKPHYSNHKDVGDKVEIGQMVLKLTSTKAKNQKPFEKVLETTTIEQWRQLQFIQTNDEEESTKPENLINLLASNKDSVLVPVKKPPTKKDVIKWLEDKNAKDATIVASEATQQESTVNNIDELESSQVLGLNENEIDSSISLECEKDKSNVNNSLQITMQPDGSFLCFGSGQTDRDTPDCPIFEMDFLTIMVLEVHTSIRAEFKPNPVFDPIQAVFISITNDCPEDHLLQKSILEIVVADELPQPKYLDRCINQNVTYVKNETEILEKIIELVKKHDPDIMCGYEIEMNSWGYVLDRSQVLGLEMVQEISRITEKNRQKRWRTDENNYEGRILGRIIFNVWRLFRHELALSSYSFENCMFEVLKERVPKYSHVQLAEWWNDESRTLRWIPVEHYLTRLSGTVRMLQKLDMINRTSELARLFGLQWWEVLSRGSQFRVESLMLRAARPLNLIALSPSVAQRAAMKAPECLPLIFEPESRFYSDPVIVLDFQSLYPSMMIAYNYCFSTCIGRVQNINGESSYEFGAWRLRIPRSKLDRLVKGGLVHWSPVGVGFVKSSVRRGVLPALLRRILAARQAVKKGMKLQTDETVKKAMHSRQLGLKLIANVTYGYTAANFSGRMPCVEVGDSVVAKGRETLQRAINLVENNTQWNAKVVYGDTDSMFVLIPGGSRQEAFRIGQEIADAVTADNPSPVALKLEKVYQPCILQTKKRYVGYMYESADQKTPVYEAKGIETVRRDGCPFAVKLLQRSLCELFTSGDMSSVKRLVVSSLSRLMDGSVSPMELFFTREYNGPHGYRPGAAAPPNEIAKRLVCSDPRCSPLCGERVSWLVSAGAPGVALVRAARTPTQLLADPHIRPHLSYYVTRVILPPLHRCLSLMGVNVFKWWNDLGYVREVQNTAFTSTTGSIARYLWRERCAVCSGKSTRSVCNSCAVKPQRAVAALAVQYNVATTHVGYCEQICASCCGHAWTAQCQNTECPVIWRRVSAQQKLQQLHDIIRQTPQHLRSTETWDF